MQLSGEYMTTNELAEKCVVSANVIRQACQQGRVKASRHGKSWFIPRLDGELYAQAYMKHNSGSTWEPDTQRRARKFHDTNPVRKQALKFDMPAHTLRLIDAERKRRAECPGTDMRKNGRANIVIEAIDRWLGEEPPKPKVSRGPYKPRAPKALSSTLTDNQ